MTRHNTLLTPLHVYGAASLIYFLHNANTYSADAPKVTALADFFIDKLAAAEWSAETLMGSKPPGRRRK